MNPTYNGQINKDDKFDRLTFGFRDLTIQELVNYSNEKNLCGKVFKAIKLIVSLKGLILFSNLGLLLEKHPRREAILKQHPHLKTLYRIHDVAVETIAKPVKPPEDNTRTILPIEKTVQTLQRLADGTEIAAKQPLPSIAEQPAADVQQPHIPEIVEQHSLQLLKQHPEEKEADQPQQDQVIDNTKITAQQLLPKPVIDPPEVPEKKSEEIMLIRFFWDKLWDKTSKLQYEILPKYTEGLTPEEKETAVRQRFPNISCPKETAIYVLNKDNKKEYIHANHAGQGVCSKNFIISQAPMLQDYSNFWTVIFNERNFIVDLTGAADRKRGVTEYAPLIIEESLKNGAINVTLKEIAQCNEVKVYTYELVDDNSNTTKTVHRLHYPNWGDHGTISVHELKALIDIFDNKLESLVHCFAGIGRSGVLVTAAILKAKIEAGEIDISNKDQISTIILEKLVEIILHLRRQRGKGVVQNEEQFELIYDYVMAFLIYKVPQKTQQSQIQQVNQQEQVPQTIPVAALRFPGFEPTQNEELKKAEVSPQVPTLSKPGQISFESGGKQFHLQATGTAIRNKYFLKIYEITSYLQFDSENQKINEQQIMQEDKAKQLTIKWIHNANAKQVQEGCEESCKKTFSKSQYTMLINEITTFINFFKLDMKKGDEYSLRWLPGGHVEAIIHGHFAGSITNLEFAKCLWNVWFGPQSVVKRKDLVSLMK